MGLTNFGVLSVDAIIGGNSCYSSLTGKTFFVAPTTGHAAHPEGKGPSDNNDGESPLTPFAAVQKALDSCVSGRGDTVVLLRGTHTPGGVLTIDKDDVRLLGYPPAPYGYGCPSLDGPSGTVNELVAVEADNVEIGFFRIGVSAQALHGIIDIADTAATSYTYLHDMFVAGWNEQAGGNGIRLGDGTNDPVECIIERCFFAPGFDGADIVWDSTRPIIKDCFFMMDDGDTAITVPTRTNATTRYGAFIVDNFFLGATDAGDEVGITFEAAEANSPLGVIARNYFANCSATAVTQDRHPEQVVENYVGDTAGGAKIDPTAV